mmetsp:Transcript_6840/g.9987  ORF Transcript_6840/g.9987 Transcript_6840/m.9987 type:complete len:303 (+) Transcript_6840:33-941(+)
MSTRNLTRDYILRRNNHFCYASDEDEEDLELINIRHDFERDIELLTVEGTFERNWKRLLDAATKDFDNIEAKLDYLKKNLSKLVNHKDQTSLSKLFEEVRLYFTNISHSIKVIDKWILNLEGSSTYVKVLQNFKQKLVQSVSTLKTDFRYVQKRATHRIEILRATHLASQKEITGVITDDDFNLVDQQMQENSALMEEYKHQQELIKHRNDELNKIAKQVTDLHEMMQDFNALVMHQGTILDRIDYQIEQSANNIKSAKRNLIQANNNDSVSSFGILVLILFIIIFILIIYLTLRIGLNWLF